MCGNASRCAGRLAHALGLGEERHVLMTDAGPIAVAVDVAAGFWWAEGFLVTTGTEATPWSAAV